MLLVNNVAMPLDSDFSLASVAKHSKIDGLLSAELYKKSVDARKKDAIVFCCSFIVKCKNEKAVLKRNKNASVYIEKKYVWQRCKSSLRPVIAGFGPAGMFCALTLARAGLRPIVLERGRDVDRRTHDVEQFWNGGELDIHSNVQFGEGGAGTFSDGKLNTGIKDPRCREVLRQFVRFGADKKILYAAKPHVGTDVLKTVVKNLRNEIISLGGEVRFESRLDGVDIKDGRLCGITVNGEYMSCSCLVLAIGHSARDTLEMLRSSGFAMERKSFAVGARIEHLQENINKSLYGEFYNHPALSVADYKLVTHLENGRAVYTFCMCPGGEVVNASSEKGMVAVNGMSNSARDGKNANSALLVEISPSDLEGDDVLAGVRLQRDIESRAYNIADGAVPICTVGELLGIKGENSVVPTVRPKTVNAKLCDVLPRFVAESIRAAIPEFDKKISGFADPDAVLTFPESRSSCPVRIIRDKNYCASNFVGIYPSGEGAGYAGGIMSAAVDGMRVAAAIIDDINKE